MSDEIFFFKYILLYDQVVSCFVSSRVSPMPCYFLAPGFVSAHLIRVLVICYFKFRSVTSFTEFGEASSEYREH